MTETRDCSRMPTVTTEEWETTVAPAKKGIKAAMVVLNGFLLVTG